MVPFPANDKYSLALVNTVDSKADASSQCEFLKSILFEAYSQAIIQYAQIMEVKILIAFFSWKGVFISIQKMSLRWKSWLSSTLSWYVWHDGKKKDSRVMNAN